MREADQNIKTYLEQLVSMKERLGKFKPPELHYLGNEELLLREGKFFKSAGLTEDEKDIIKKALESLSFEPQMKECFYNSQMLAIYDTSGQIKYHEGFCFSGILPMLHGFNSINGKVIDITWTGKNGKPIFGKFLKDRSYHGITIPTKDVSKMQQRTEMAQSHLDNWTERHPLLRRKFNPESPYKGLFEEEKV